MKYKKHEKKERRKKSRKKEKSHQKKIYASNKNNESKIAWCKE